MQTKDLEQVIKEYLEQNGYFVRQVAISNKTLDGKVLDFDGDIVNLESRLNIRVEKKCKQS